MQDLKKLRGLRFVKKREGDWNDTSEIKVLPENINDILPALQWACEDQLNFSLTPYDETTCQIQLPGRFSILLDSEKILHDLVQVWKILGNKYPKFEDIFKTENDIKWIQETLLYLIDMAEGSDAKLPAWVRHVLKIRNA